MGDYVSQGGLGRDQPAAFLPLRGLLYTEKAGLGRGGA